jgi:hypothetical protein
MALSLCSRKCFQQDSILAGIGGVCCTYKPATPTYSGPTVSFIPKTANCTQPVLSSRAAAKDSTLGLRMRGTYEGIDGLTIEFYPDSAIVGCGKVARAYPYIVRANGAQAAIKIEDRVHPLLLAFKTDGELDPGQGQFQVPRTYHHRHG